MAHRKFIDEPTQEGDEPEPIAFTLGGVGSIDGQKWEESFSAVPVAPGGVLDDLTSSVSLDERTGNTVVHHMRVLQFFRGVLIDDDVERFEALVRDKNRVVPLEKLADILAWLTEELTGRPTQPSSTSGRGRRNAGTTSTGGSRSKG